MDETPSLLHKDFEGLSNMSYILVQVLSWTLKITLDH